MGRTNMIQSASVYLVFETTINYGTENDVRQPHLPISIMTINYGSVFDPTIPRLALVREDDKLLTSSLQHVQPMIDYRLDNNTARLRHLSLQQDRVHLRPARAID